MSDITITRPVVIHDGGIISNGPEGVVVRGVSVLAAEEVPDDPQA